MAKKKAIAKSSPTQDISWEQHGKLLATIESVRSYFVLASVLILLIVTLLAWSLIKINDKIAQLANDQGNLAFYQKAENQKLDLLASTDNTSPFCYGFDQYGIKGYGVDGSKVTKACEVVK